MTTNVKTLVPGHFLHTTVSTHYTVPVNTKAVIHNATVANTASSVAHTLTLYLVDVGASEALKDVIVSSRVLAPLETYKFPDLIGKPISATGTIRALCSSTSTLTFNVGGVEVV